MNILLINVHSNCNAGDAALTQVSVEQLKQNFPECQVTIMMDDPSSSSGEDLVVGSLLNWLLVFDENRRSRWRIRNLLWCIPACLFPLLTFRLLGKAVYIFTPSQLRTTIQSYFQADLVVSKPGGFLYSSGLGVALLINSISMALAHWANKPLYLLPQSIGPFRRKWECFVMKWLFDHVRILMVRESLSLDQVHACNISHPRCILVPDPAFAYLGGSRTEAKKWLSSKGISPNHIQPLLGITVINWHSQNPHFEHQQEYENAIVAVSSFFIEHYGGKVILFNQVQGPSESQDDRVAARSVFSKLSSLHNSIILVEDPLPPNLLKPIYGFMDIFVGTRMHSNIFALSEGIPVIAIGYQYKTQGILQMLNLEKWYVDIQEVSEKKLINLLREIWTERETIRRQIGQSIPPITAQTKQIGLIIAQDYNLLSRINNNHSGQKN